MTPCACILAGCKKKTPTSYHGLLWAFVGFVSVYGHRVSEIDEMLEVRRIAGVCPQSDIHFDILTVEENLSLFAAIKGIPQNDLIQEVGGLYPSIMLYHRTEES